MLIEEGPTANLYSKGSESLAKEHKMEDKVVLITGASSGIGAATAEHFADIGYRKFSLVARREEKLKELAEKCKAKGAKDVLILSLDLSDMECAKSAVVKTVEHFKSK